MAGEMGQLAKTRIGQAIQSGNAEELLQCFTEGEDVLFRDRKGNTYIHFISTMYQPAVFYVLATQKIDVNAQNRHGFTALHVTALQQEGQHLADLLCIGADPYIRSRDGKLACEMTKNVYWHSTYNKYMPGIFKTVENHDVKRLKELLHCWTKINCIRKGQTLRQFAAALKFHDIVSVLDQHTPTLDVIYGVLENDHEKVKESLKKSRLDINYLNQVSQRRHVLQHALKFKDVAMIHMLCDAGADVNITINVKNYFKGQLYFEAIDASVPPIIMWKILKSGANFSLKDERGRNAMIYALDKSNGHIPLEVIQYMLKHGADIADRDETGVTIRDVARFSRRLDIVDLIDKFYVNIIRRADMAELERLTIAGYDGMLLEREYRDSYIYAAGNESDEVLKYIVWLAQHQRDVTSLQTAIKTEPKDLVENIIQQSQRPDLLLNTKDKGLRTPLMLAILFGREDVVSYLLRFKEIQMNEQDSCNRTCLHYAFMVGDLGVKVREMLLQRGVDTDIRDVVDKKAEDYVGYFKSEEWIKREREAHFGMEVELLCVDKYEELRKLVCAKRKTVKDLESAIRDFPIPISEFPKILGPLMPSYRDLIFLAVDHCKVELAVRLADLGANLWRKEMYVIKKPASVEESSTNESSVTEIYMDVVERAYDIYLEPLADILQTKRERQSGAIRPFPVKQLRMKDVQEFLRQKSDIYKAAFFPEKELIAEEECY